MKITLEYNNLKKSLDVLEEDVTTRFKFSAPTQYLAGVLMTQAKGDSTLALNYVEGVVSSLVTLCNAMDTKKDKADKAPVRIMPPRKGSYDKKSVLTMAKLMEQIAKECTDESVKKLLTELMEMFKETFPETTAGVATKDDRIASEGKERIIRRKGRRGRDNELEITKKPVSDEVPDDLSGIDDVLSDVAKEAPPAKKRKKLTSDEKNGKPEDRTEKAKKQEDTKEPVKEPENDLRHEEHPSSSSVGVKSHHEEPKSEPGDDIKEESVDEETDDTYENTENEDMEDTADDDMTSNDADPFAGLL